MESYWNLNVALDVSQKFPRAIECNLLTVYFEVLYHFWRTSLSAVRIGLTNYSIERLQMKGKLAKLIRIFICVHLFNSHWRRFVKTSAQLQMHLSLLP